MPSPCRSDGDKRKLPASPLFAAWKLPGVLASGFLLALLGSWACLALPVSFPKVYYCWAVGLHSHLVLWWCDRDVAEGLTRLVKLGVCRGTRTSCDRRLQMLLNLPTDAAKQRYHTGHGINAMQRRYASQSFISCCHALRGFGGGVRDNRSVPPVDSKKLISSLKESTKSAFHFVYSLMRVVAWHEGKRR